MSNTYPVQSIPLLQISAVDPDRYCFVAIHSVGPGEPIPADATNFRQLERMMAQLERFTPAPWRQYWAVNALTPDIQYLGEFNDPDDAVEKLEASDFLRKEEMFVVNCSGAASLLVSGNQLQSTYNHPKGFKATLLDSSGKTSVQYFEAPVLQGYSMATQLFSSDDPKVSVTGVRVLRKYEDPFLPEVTWVATFSQYSRGFGGGAEWTREIQATTQRDASDVAGKFADHPDDHLVSVERKR
ncbi:hypothetical protein [Xanthomonas phage RTH11]|nr:hypothetical protein [Xanthomonas phage RTH11]